MAIMELIFFMVPYFFNFFLNTEGYGKYYHILKNHTKFIAIKTKF